MCNIKTTLITNDEFNAIIYSAWMYLNYHAELSFVEFYMPIVQELFEQIRDNNQDYWEITKIREDY